MVPYNAVREAIEIQRPALKSAEVSVNKSQWLAFFLLPLSQADQAASVLVEVSC
jgi:hypothetical protein